MSDKQKKKELPEWRGDTDSVKEWLDWLVEAIRELEKYMSTIQDMYDD